jgi:hypothetical protein
MHDEPSAIELAVDIGLPHGQIERFALGIGTGVALDRAAVAERPVGIGGEVDDR